MEAVPRGAASSRIRYLVPRTKVLPSGSAKWALVPTIPFWAESSSQVSCTSSATGTGREDNEGAAG
jgi:hypothetical protein